jgi:hypothetical protein
MADSNNVAGVNDVVASQAEGSHAYILRSGGIVVEGSYANGRVVEAGGVVEERRITVGPCCRSQWCCYRAH